MARQWRFEIVFALLLLTSAQILPVSAQPPRRAPTPNDALVSQVRDVQVRILVNEKRLNEAYAIASAATREANAGIADYSRLGDVLEAMDRHDQAADAFDAKFAQFKNNLDHHVEEEENEMFVMLKQRMSTEQQEELGQRIHARKANLKMRFAA